MVQVKDGERLQRCISALARYNKTPLKMFERAGRTYGTLPLKLPFYYTFEGGRAYLSTSTEGIEAMIDLPATGRSLADVPTFERLRRRLPQEYLLMWAVDLSWAAAIVPLAVAAAPDLRTVVSMAELDRLLTPLRTADPGPSFGAALRNEPTALVLHLEITAETSQ